MRRRGTVKTVPYARKRTFCAAGTRWADGIKRRRRGTVKTVPYARKRTFCAAGTRWADGIKRQGAERSRPFPTLENARFGRARRAAERSRPFPTNTCGTWEAGCTGRISSALQRTRNLFAREDYAKRGGARGAGEHKCNRCFHWRRTAETGRKPASRRPRGAPRRIFLPITENGQTDCVLCMRPYEFLIVYKMFAKKPINFEKSSFKRPKKRKFEPRCNGDETGRYYNIDHKLAIGVFSCCFLNGNRIVIEQAAAGDRSAAKLSGR